MSENMKKIYQAYADSIAPAPDMQARLKRQLYAEMQGERPRKRDYGRGQFSRWLVVACMLFLVSSGCLTYAVMGTSGQTGRAAAGSSELTQAERVCWEKKMWQIRISNDIRRKKSHGSCRRCWNSIPSSCFAARKMAVVQESRCACRRMNFVHCADHCRVQQSVRT